MTADPKPARVRPATVRRDELWKAASIGWHRWAVRLGCQVCPALGGECEGILQGHHVVYRQFVAGRVDTLAYEQGLGRAAKADLLRELVWDRRNAMGVCYRAHRRHHNGTAPIPLALVPLAAITFAAEIGLTRRIEDLYPCPA